MDRQRLRFFLALALFLGWVLALGTLAWLSGEKPQLRASAPVER
ncbi:hypothetical protein P12x_002524 [Tundrisphaera lichenicola]